jgi:hypothetical protein
LGLSILWSEYNLGATSPEDFGEYFAWGETQPKESYEKDTYLYYDQSMKQYIDIGEDISGTKYDAAHVNIGNGWRMPTKTELQELRNNCEWEWTKIGNILGYKVIGKNGNFIFIPAAGVMFYKILSNENDWIEYWSSTIVKTGDANIIVETGHERIPTIDHYHKESGFSIRPVKSK